MRDDQLRTLKSVVLVLIAISLTVCVTIFVISLVQDQHWIGSPLQLFEAITGSFFAGVFIASGLIMMNLDNPLL